jgi:mannitol-specific phosphotransferase system IIBC component
MGNKKGAAMIVTLIGGIHEIPFCHAADQVDRV